MRFSHWFCCVAAMTLLWVAGCIEEPPHGNYEPDASDNTTDVDEGEPPECGGVLWSGEHPGGNPWEIDELIDCEAIAASWDCGLAEDEEAVVELVNEMRAEPQTCGETVWPAAGPVEHVPLMRCASRLHAWDQQHRGYYSHDSPEGHGPGYRMNKTGAGTTAAENIFMTTMDPEGTMAGWMNSPGHCQNIMNGDYSYIGVGRFGGHWVMKLIW